MTVQTETKPADTAKNIDSRYFFALGALVFCVYAPSLVNLFEQWWNSPEYGHGLFMPFVVGYMIYRKLPFLAKEPLQSSVFGIFMLLAALSLLLAATLADIESIKHYSFCIALSGLILLYGGFRFLKIALTPLLLLFLVIPLPYLLISSLTAGLQLVSSELGTGLIRFFGIPVFLEGNIIDMGTYKLQVVEACSGLRYLYPLLSISLLVAYFLKTPLWFKAFIVLSTIPVTIFMNSLRIAITGVLVNQYGNEVAEGFLHDFEGWVVFLAAFVCLMAEVWLFKAIFIRKGSLHDLFDFSSTESSEKSVVSQLSLRSCLSAIALTFFIGGSALYLAFNSELRVPERSLFAEFPMRIDGRNVVLDSFGQDVLDILKPDDYFIGSYHNKVDNPVGLYMVYYAQQKDGSALHSPKVCIPGGGWVVEDERIEAFNLNGGDLEVNRVVIRKGELTQLVYYWIDQMGVSYTNEYLARASLIKNAVMQNRSDGSLVRVNIVVSDQDFLAADIQLQNFIRGMSGSIGHFLPQ
ncbi:VPLPA-CTERM-specific exosortase XrtD [Neptuniibacter caesariensis]|uniref:Methanolan biosynthesis EpsI domain-containing protein n=1 Tax=Neptuniibacter caesariensis TaxID=207954 RepID=A0A7U8GR71_NEPCE|nr:VPLPA-CTERM-specific exosortase XrtD [Neptuniibacter caesariensis]EAR59923.1 hypothetical protein MED92_15970 [Oceanospirillum sp. MED92] [Neptuniibacter caesariensis]